MNARLKQRWVKALTSGKYVQCTKYLHDSKTGGYCCLGVLEKLRTGETPDSSFPLTGPPTFFANEHGYMNDLANGLADMNDDGVPFDVIAGFIRENL